MELGSAFHSRIFDIAAAPRNIANVAPVGLLKDFDVDPIPGPGEDTMALVVSALISHWFDVAPSRYRGSLPTVLCALDLCQEQTNRKMKADLLAISHHECLSMPIPFDRFLWCQYHFGPHQPMLCTQCSTRPRLNAYFSTQSSEKKNWNQNYLFFFLLDVRTPLLNFKHQLNIVEHDFCKYSLPANPAQSRILASSQCYFDIAQSGMNIFDSNSIESFVDWRRSVCENTNWKTSI